MRAAMSRLRRLSWVRNVVSRPVFRGVRDAARYHVKVHRPGYTAEGSAARPIVSRSDSMRYRRLSYRYAVVMATGRSRPFGDAWPRQAPSVGLARPWRPATDVVETAAEVIVTVELAGVDHDELDVLLFE